jgi:hypothetical protein
MKIKNKLKFWTVVSVYSGIPCRVKHFINKKQAIVYSKKLRSQINEYNDEIGLFESII